MLAHNEIKALWTAHGGGQHGPHVETYTITEVDFWRFAEAFQRAVVESTATVPIKPYTPTTPSFHGSGG